MKISKLRVTGLCEGNSLVTGEFPAQKASDTENISIGDVIMNVSHLGLVIPRRILKKYFVI